ncbi:MAG: DUF5666 domain-containing protein, partial [Deltaproteobacteria bacterium]|nr:DUF5666 domain-containing protein [Deltaproteobacteria bacterium]
MRRIEPLLALLLAVCLAANGAAAENRCAGGGAPYPDEGGIGGTGHAPGSGDDSGLGGTGLLPDDPGQDDSGVGGTGVSASGERGVIGTITGFASICVDGVELHYDDATRVRIDGAAARVADLAVGQVVEVVAGGADDALRASEVSVRHVVVGPVTRVLAEADAIEVIGQTVRLSATTRGDAGGAARVADFPLGAVVQVSGLRQADGAIAASQVRLAAGDVARLSGPLSLDAAGGAAIAGTRIAGLADDLAAASDEVRVSGRWDGDVLRATAVEPLPRLPFDGRVARVQIEGFASPAGADRVRVGAYTFELPDADSADVLRGLGAGARVQLDAVVRDQRAVIERIDAAPQLP